MSVWNVSIKKKKNYLGHWQSTPFECSATLYSFLSLLLCFNSNFSFGKLSRYLGKTLVVMCVFICQISYVGNISAARHILIKLYMKPEKSARLVTVNAMVVSLLHSGVWITSVEGVFMQGLLWLVTKLHQSCTTSYQEI